MSIRQGDIFWVSPSDTNKILSDHAHPHVVVQVNEQNAVIVCALTSNLKRAKEPGNVLLDEGEANLPKQSVIVVIGNQSFVAAKPTGPTRRQNNARQSRRTV